MPKLLSPPDLRKAAIALARPRTPSDALVICGQSRERAFRLSISSMAIVGIGEDFARRKAPGTCVVVQSREFSFDVRPRRGFNHYPCGAQTRDRCKRCRSVCDLLVERQRVSIVSSRLKRVCCGKLSDLRVTARRCLRDICVSGRGLCAIAGGQHLLRSQKRAGGILPLLLVVTLPELEAPRLPGSPPPAPRRRSRHIASTAFRTVRDEHLLRLRGRYRTRRNPLWAYGPRAILPQTFDRPG